MKKKLTTIFLAIVLPIIALPAHIHAEGCVKHQWGEWYETKKFHVLVMA